MSSSDSYDYGERKPIEVKYRSKDIKVISYAPNVFRSIRQLHDVDEKVYEVCVAKINYDIQ